jgi:aspartate racemase
MEKDFYKGRLENKHGIQVIIPQEGEREIVHRVIYDELILGDIRPASKEQYIVVMENLINQGAQGIILGCTEIPLLVGEGDVDVPVFDTMNIHAEAAVAYALEGVLQP